MKILRSILLAGSIATAMAAQAQAQTLAEAQICVRGSDERSIEVLLPGNVGKACDLRYTRDGGANVRVPYHANSSRDFCAQKAIELVQSLRAAGFECGASNASQTAEAPQQVPAPAQPAAPGIVVETESEPVVIAPTDSGIASTPEIEREPAPVANTALAGSTPGPIVNQTTEVETAVAATDLSTPPATRQQLVAPPAQARLTQSEEPYGVAAGPAVRGPQSLTRATAPTMVAATPRPRSSRPGRIVGAPPDPVTSGADVATNVATGAVVEDRQGRPSAKQLTVAQTVAKKPLRQASLDTAPMPKTIQKMRPAPDIIRGVLNAQAASWNDGDLEGFMAGYWKSPDLRFISGTDVTTGWSQIMKRYKSRYGDGESLGILTFDDLDVEMVSEGVAVVVGEFNLTRGDAADEGKFTLVLKQFDGRWRIVHDHTVTAPTVQ